MNDLERYKDVTAIVEVTSYETLCLWEKWHQQRGYTWEESRSGPLITVGYINNTDSPPRPVCIAPLVHIVNGRSIMFLEATSAVVDWDMIETWLRENVPSACTRKGGGNLHLNKETAQNFHCLVH